MRDNQDKEGTRIDRRRRDRSSGRLDAYGAAIHRGSHPRRHGQELGREHTGADATAPEGDRQRSGSVRPRLNSARTAVAPTLPARLIGNLRVDEGVSRFACHAARLLFVPGASTALATLHDHRHAAVSSLSSHGERRSTRAVAGRGPDDDPIPSVTLGPFASSHQLPLGTTCLSSAGVLAPQGSTRPRARRQTNSGAQESSAAVAEPGG